MKTVTYMVCPECWDEPNMNDCICGYQKVERIKKTFQICECCNRRYDNPINEEEEENKDN